MSVDARTDGRLPADQVVRVNLATFEFDQGRWLLFVVTELFAAREAGESGFKSAARTTLERLRIESPEMSTLRSSVLRLRQVACQPFQVAKLADQPLTEAHSGSLGRSLTSLDLTDTQVFAAAHKALAVTVLHHLADVAVEVGAAEEHTRGMGLVRKVAKQAWGWLKDPWYREIADHDTGVLGLGLFTDAVTKAIRMDRCDPEKATSVEIDAWEDAPSSLVEEVLTPGGEPRHLCARIASARKTGRHNEARGGKDKTEIRRGTLPEALALSKPDDDEGPLDELMRDEERSSVRRALESLPDKSRRLLEGRAIEGKGYPELAVEHGFENPDQVRHAYNKAVLDMRKLLQDWALSGRRIDF